ncbi:MAG: DUF2279 domain-containing protein [Bacteroidetes bacterium]|nr:DUF2279 domain-containing protein [Bacteroidota bacterium]MBS1925843.1 DUF2279 domain-containing protein [Bacteroidota bacterium]MCC6692967.1 DUF2279 domain-containing protein [Chitinophagaceae bacterium]
MIPADVHYWAAWATLRSAFKWFIILFFLLYAPVSFAQDSASLKPVNFKNQTVSKKKVRLLTLASIGAYAGTTAALYHTWYKKYPQTHFHTFNDWDEWMQMDKVGHVLSAYSISKVNMELWRWTGVDRKKRIWIGGMSGAVYQTVIETLDGFSSEWGWSWGDFGANMLGSSAFVAQELAWDEQRIQLKLSSHRKRYADASLNQRSNEIFGKSLPERLLKDYNAYTYWISVTPKSFFPKSNLPPWLQLSLGIGAEGMFGARSNIARDKQGNIIYDRSDIKRYRQWYLAPDIDLTKIKTNKKGIRILLNTLNVIKFPAPALEYSRGSFKMRWLVF